MRIEATDARKRTWDHLTEATGENTKSGALDVAANYYLKMRGGTAAVPTGSVAELMELAEKQGNVTAAEIAEILGAEELPLEHESTWKIGRGLNEGNKS